VPPGRPETHLLQHPAQRLRLGGDVIDALDAERVRVVGECLAGGVFVDAVLRMHCALNARWPPGV